MIRDPLRPLGTTLESERLPGGPPWSSAPALTVFLAGARCPFSCVFCDLWKTTLPGATPEGALPAQLASALGAFPAEALTGGTLKLYNASNFFEPRAVPPSDWRALARQAAPFPRVVVENHPRLVGDSARRFADLLGGSRLEVAMGLETVHPEAFPRLQKGMRLAEFDRAAERLRDLGLGIRVFVLVGGLFFPVEEAAGWAVRAVDHALGHGAEHVTLIPLRPPPEQPTLVAPRLADLEAALDAVVEPAARRGAVVTVDLWDFERVATCPVCAPERRERLERIHRSGRSEPPFHCGACS